MVFGSGIFGCRTLLSFVVSCFRKFVDVVSIGAGFSFRMVIS